MQKNYWLMKTEPTVFSFDDLKAKPEATDHWEGVRNYQARNYMREMKKGDLALFYHSNCELPGIVGIAEIVRTSYPDHTSWDKSSRYYDPKSTPQNPRWFMVDVRWKKQFENIISLTQLKDIPALQQMKVLQKGQRLSVMPVTQDEFKKVLKLAGTTYSRKT
ncbi:MAG: EVE domain-containing protein [Thermodesulfovibrio sp.]|nr:EVE domain-containing protein [Thermodesulfovibrio sp.]